MSYSNFNGSSNLGLPGSGLASRRGGQAIKPLSIDANVPGPDKDGSLATPRTSRSHLLAGLRTAPKSATAASFPQGDLDASATNNQIARTAPGPYSSNGTTYNGPKTSMPRFAQGQTYNSSYTQQHQPRAQHHRLLQQQQQQQLQQHQLQQQELQVQTLLQNHQLYTAEEILAPPELGDDASSSDPEYAADVLAARAYFAQQQQRLQHQLLSVQVAQQQVQQLQQLSLNGNPNQAQAAYQHLLYQQHEAVHQSQKQQQQQPTLTFVGQAAHVSSQQVTEQYHANLQQLQYLHMLQQQQQQQQVLFQQQQQGQPTGSQMLQQQYQQSQSHVMHRQSSPANAPRVKVSPPPSDGGFANHGLRNISPPRRTDASTPFSDHAPLPPPSANAFRRGHKKSSSLFGGAGMLDVNSANAAAAGQDIPKSAGPKTSTFAPGITQVSGSYGPGQGRAGEHPTRQPRGPPNLEELVAKPTSKHEGSKNFATRMRRSAVHNLVRAGFTRRQGTIGSSDSISPISETVEEPGTSLSDDESVSGRSGSGSLNGDDVESSLPSSRTSTGSWGAIGSERPGSRDKGTARKSTESLKTSGSDSESASGAGAPGSFASVFKQAKPSGETQQRERVVLSKNIEKRRFVS